MRFLLRLQAPSGLVAVWLQPLEKSRDDLLPVQQRSPLPRQVEVALVAQCGQFRRCVEVGHRRGDDNVMARQRRQRFGLFVFNDVYLACFAGAKE